MVSLKNLWFVATALMAAVMVIFMRPKESISHSLNSSFLQEHLHSASNNSSISEHLFRPDEVSPPSSLHSASNNSSMSEHLFRNDEVSPPSSLHSASNNSSMSEHLFRNDEIKNNTTRTEGSERKYSNLAKVEADLAQARALIRAELEVNQTDLVDPDYIPTGPMYWDPKTFHRSYREMEKRLKVYVYEEGEPPIFHLGPCKNIYAIEGIFMASMEVSLFRTFDPEEAHLFFLPISIAMITKVIYVPESHDWTLMKRTASDYINVIANKYPYWNRSLGADHFMLACHDWGPGISFAIPNLHKNAIRALCNANTSEKFNPSRDVSIPEIHLPMGTTRGLLGGPPPSRRPILVFYAGRVHGPIRPILLQHWENASDPDVQVHGRYLPRNMSYYGMMRKSRYCICPSGYEVASPRMVEGLYMGCVPVLIKDNYVVPFGDVLDWEKFAVIVAVRDIPNLKRILAGISLREYVKLQRQGIKMRRHFEVNMPPRRYDVFGMILHSIWLRRLNVRLRGDIQ